jgi:tRNA(fMet)-specific endonuclease VapC
MIFLLDTNIISDLMRRPQGMVARRLAAATEDEVITSVVVACEIRFGLARHPSPRIEDAWHSLRTLIPVAALGKDVIASYGQTRAALERAGTPIGPNDLLIAAHALSLDALVVTDNVREFERVPGLRVENWLAVESRAP